MAATLISLCPQLLLKRGTPRACNLLNGNFSPQTTEEIRPSGKVGHFTNTHTLGEGGTYQPPRSRQKHTAWVMCASSVMRACCVLMVMWHAKRRDLRVVRRAPWSMCSADVACTRARVTKG